MKVAIAGSSGLIGTALVHALEKQDHEVLRLVRRAPENGNEIRWNPQAGALNPEDFGKVDAVINLAGENIGLRRWNEQRKKEIYDSRVLGTRLLCRIFEQLPRPPSVLLNASAVGIYGSRGAEVVDEDSDSGSGFLASLCSDWEAAADTASAQGVRVVKLRFALVLSKEGGALASMLTPFRLGLGGPVGDGTQYVSWVSLHDAVRAILFCLESENVAGAVNIASPAPVQFSAFAKALGRVLHRPAFIPLPAFVVKLIFGEMGEETILSSVRALPKKLEELKFTFEDRELDSGLRRALL